MQKVYIFFFGTQFKTGKTIRFLTHNKYNHIALSLTPDTGRLYTYTRYRYHEPILAGFDIEFTDRYYYKNQTPKLKVYEYEVSDELYEHIKGDIDFYIRHKDKTRYNFADIITYPFKKHVNIPLTHTCLSFVLELLERNDVHSIGQFEKSLPKETVIYEGTLEAFENKQPSHGEYDFYEKRNRLRVLAASCSLLCGLCAGVFKRIIEIL